MIIEDVKTFVNYVNALMRSPQMCDEYNQLPDELKKQFSQGLTPEMVSPEVIRRYLIGTIKKELPNMVVDDDLSEALDQLVAALNEKKGIMLMGNIGCGKTTLLKAWGDLLRLFQIPMLKKLEVTPTYRITSEYNQKGDVIFGCSDEFGFRPSHLVQDIQLFDDLGSEAIGNHFGRACNVMEEILLRRYDTKAQTHCTTNLDATAIRELYGPRVASRLKEMFLRIHVKGDDRRK